MTDKVKLNIDISLNEITIKKHLKNLSIATDNLLNFGVKHQSLDNVEHWHNIIKMELRYATELTAANEKMRDTIALKDREDVGIYERLITTLRNENDIIRRHLTVQVDAKESN